MLAIRMQRVGRKGHAQYRVVVQDKRFSPKSGRVVAYVGSYNPHAKSATLDSNKIANYLKSGAQPSDRVAHILRQEGVKMPEWIAKPTKQKRSIRNPEKLRRNRPDEAQETPAPAAEEVPVKEPAVEDSTEPEAVTEQTATKEQPPEKAAAETPPAEEAEAKPEGQ